MSVILHHCVLKWMIKKELFLNAVQVHLLFIYIWSVSILEISFKLGSFHRQILSTLRAFEGFMATVTLNFIAKPAAGTKSKNLIQFSSLFLSPVN